MHPRPGCIGRVRGAAGHVASLGLQQLAVQGGPRDPDSPFVLGGSAGRYSCPTGDVNTVGGDIVFQGKQVPATIADNRVRGRLLCLTNDPAPAHSGNQPASRTAGQCAES